MGQQQSADASRKSAPGALTSHPSLREVSALASTAVSSPQVPWSPRYLDDTVDMDDTTEAIDAASPPPAPAPVPHATSPTNVASSDPPPPAPRRSMVSKLFGASSARPSLPEPTVHEDKPSEFADLTFDPIVPQPIAQVPMQRSNVTTHLRPSFVTALSLPRLESKLGRRRSTATVLTHKASTAAMEETTTPADVVMADVTTASGVTAEKVGSSDDESVVSSPSSSSGSAGSLSDDEESVEEYGSSSSDEDLMGEDDLEVNDWLDEPMDAVFTPKKSDLSSPSHNSSRRGRSFSSVSSTSTNASRAGGGHTHSMSGSMLASGGRPSLPNHLGGNTTSNSSLSTWLSGQEDADDELDFDYEPMVLTEFMRENMPVYEVMKQVQLFRNLSQNQQEQVLRALKPAKFPAGEIIVQQGTRGSRFYMIAKGEAVITKKTDADDHERMITHLHPGHYFGELALIYDDPRTATVRAVSDCELLYLTQEDFQRIGQVHLSLMLQQVPLLAQLNGCDQDAVLSRLKPSNFNDGDYIVRQGDQGTRFYMITRGEAVVTEKDTRPEAKEGQERELTRLYEGHVFGEMALIYSEPRTASVRAIGPVKCLYLTKEDFDKCLTSERFHRFIQHAYVEKATRRAMRMKVQQRAEKESATPMAATPGATSFVNGGLVPPPAPVSPVRATETKKLVRRLKNGQKVVNKYVIKGDLGKGTFGRVKLCQSEEDGKLYAVKIMHRTFVQRMAGKEDQLQDVLRREVAIMKKLNHRNVVKLVEVIDDPSSQKMYLVQEYVQHNLMDVVNRARGLKEEVARKYTRDLLIGLNYLHFHKVIHRDIKPENILVSADGVAKIADFGTARMVMNESESISGAKGTPAFMAPEMFDLDATYQGPSVDVWSLGATLYMMLIGVPPWLADNEIILAERVQHDELTFPADYERTMEPHLKNLLQRMLTKNPKLRITLGECFTHDWITKEGSDPLAMVTGQSTEGNDLMTVSIDESERAIQNIPERIDLSLSEFLEQAHNLVKTRQQTGGSNHSIHRTGSGHSWPTGGSANGNLQEKQSSSSSLVENRSVSSSASSPNRASSTEETSRIIRAWRHHKRVQLMYGHKELSAKSRELLLEQKRVAFSAERAKVTEIILPATGPSSSASASKIRATPLAGAGGPLSPRDRHMSSPAMLEPSSLSLAKKNSFGASTADEVLPLHEKSITGFGRTSFKSVSGMSDLMSIDETVTEKSFRESSSDADLLKRSLSRKKDFLMVTSEVFRDEEGDFQSRKILFQARDHDFSVASRAPAHKSGRHLGRNSSSQMKKTGSRRSLTSSISAGSVGSVDSNSSTKLETTGVSARNSEIDLDGIDCVQVTYDGEEEDEEMEYGDDGGNKDYDSGSSSDAGSDYSDVEGDVDVEETFNDLICSSNALEIEPDDDEIAPVDPTSTPPALLLSPTNHSRQIVQVYVSSKIRENLALGIRSGYAEAKGSRSYMEDKSVGVTQCSFDTYDAPTREKLQLTYKSLGFFAVYDGHNGDDTAKFLQSELHHRFFRHPDFATKPVAAITDVCAVVDEELLDKQNRSVATPKRKRTDDDIDEGEEGAWKDECNDGGQERRTPACLQPISFSGSTAVFVIVGSRPVLTSEENAVGSASPQAAPCVDRETVLYVANLGDSRAVLCTANGMAVDLTKDHKASDDDEKKGIEARGGFVHNGRLDGVLAISRGFGDLAHKTEGHLGSVPDVTERVVASDDEFVLLASDGLFDVLSSQQAVNFIYRKLRLHGDVQLAAQEMVLKAQQYFAHDNISVVIVGLNQNAGDNGSVVSSTDGSVATETTPRPSLV